MVDRNTTKRMFTHMINMMEQHDTMTISCGDPLIELLKDVRELLKEQEKLVDVDALREKLGFAKDCAKCKQNTRACQLDSHFSLMNFCERFDMAIEELMQEGR